ncbi:MAG TPA: cupin domain-containing protein [Steroidobacteraceae bacterium]|nr:cupin domain-containing protein [Steroidobacteraceae bacterium]
MRVGRFSTQPVESEEQDASGYFDPNRYDLDPAPIQAEWILEGAPVARGRPLCGSTDDNAFTVMWDCTAGRFNWFYDIDETIHIVEGSALLKSTSGEEHVLTPGDVFLCAAGTRYEWTVDSYVRKIAFVHRPMSRKMRLLQRLYHAVAGLLKPRSKSAPDTEKLLSGS